MGNPVVHFEIAGPDGNALRQFYQELFGWTVFTHGDDHAHDDDHDHNENILNYGLVQTNEGGIGGGIFQTDESMPPNYVTFYIQVDDLQDALDKISHNGGAALMPPMEIAPGMGSIAMFTDPADNFIGLYSLPNEWNGDMPPKGNAPPVVHFELGGSDSNALDKFYANMFGWKTTLVENINYRLVQQEADGIGGGIFEHAEGMPPNAPSIAVQVDDLQTYLDKAVSLGATALMQPTQVPGGFGCFAVFNDIAGNRIAMFNPPRN